MVSLGHFWQGREEDISLAPATQRTLRRSDAFIRLAVAAASEVLQGESGADIGLVLCSAYGPMETNFDVLQMVVDGEAVSPALFSHSVFNAAAGYIASVCSLQGALFTITDFDLPFFRGVQQGWLAVNSGLMRRCLVIQVETYSRLLNDAVVDNGGGEPWPSMAVCWSLEEGDGCLVAMPDLSPLGEERRALVQNAWQEGCNHPLALASMLTTAIYNGNRKACKVQSHCTEFTMEFL